MNATAVLRVVSRLFLLTTAICVSACSRDEGLSPEEQIKAFLDHAETAVEARDLSAASEIISERYTDKAGRDQREVKRLLMGYFLRNRSIRLLMKVDEIHLVSPANAKVLLTVGMAGQGQQAPSEWSQWRGDLQYLELDLVRETGDQWRLLSAGWSRTRP